MNAQPIAIVRASSWGELFDCAARWQGLEAALPARAARPERPVRVGLAFLALREDAHVLLRRRPEAGLLGGMLEVPSAEWADTLPSITEALRVGAKHVIDLRPWIVTRRLSLASEFQPRADEREDGGNRRNDVGQQVKHVLSLQRQSRFPKEP